MEKKKLRQIEREIQRIKKQLGKIGDMRPGSLTKQYRNPKEKKGPYYQISYTHKMKSRTDYVRPMFIRETRLQIKNYKRFKILTEKWIELSIKSAKLKMEIAKKEFSD